MPLEFYIKFDFFLENFLQNAQPVIFVEYKSHILICAVPVQQIQLGKALLFCFFFSLYSVLSYCSLPSFLPALLSPTPLLYDDINGNQIAKKWRSILKGHHLRETLDVFGLHFECCICVPSCTQKVLLTQQSSREFNSVIQAGSCQTEMEAFFLRKEKKLFEQFIRKM